MKIRLACVAMLMAAMLSERAGSENPRWRLTWSDEFNGADGSSPDPAKWKFDIGGGRWGNRELESYTSRAENVEQRGGNLVITARKEEYKGIDGVVRHFTSGRIKTRGLFAQAYGRFEARIQVPVGKGIWPAWWMLGEDIGTARWPKAGEVDVMECIGDPLRIYSTLHGPGYSGGKGISAKFAVPSGEEVNNGFHVYAVEWAPNDIRFFFDAHLIAERTPKDLPHGAVWVYDHPFFLLLNVAVGGTWPGYPDKATVFPQRMLVDYVRVYSR